MAALEEVVSWGIPRIVESMNLRREDVEFQLVGCKALASLASDSANDEKLLECEAIECILKALETHRSDPVAQQQGLTSLMALSCVTDLKVVIMKAGGLDHIIIALNKHRTNPDVGSAACGVLQNLTVISEFSTYLLAHGCLEQVFKAVSANADHAPLLAYACGLLQNLSAHEDCRPVLVRDGVIDFVIAALQRMQTATDVQENALGVVQNLAAESAIREKLLSAGLLPLVNDALRRHTDNSAVALQAFRCLLALGGSTLTEMRTVAESGSAELIVAAMQKQRSNSDLQRRGFAALQRLVRGWLVKQGKDVKSWRRRWFEFFRETLCYFESPEATQQEVALGRIPMRSVTSVRASNAMGKQNLIEIGSIGRTYFMEAETEAQRNMWVSVLTCVMGRSFK